MRDGTTRGAKSRAVWIVYGLLAEIGRHGCVNSMLSDSLTVGKSMFLQVRQAFGMHHCFLHATSMAVA